MHCKENISPLYKTPVHCEKAPVHYEKHMYTGNTVRRQKHWDLYIYRWGEIYTLLMAKSACRVMINEQSFCGLYKNMNRWFKLKLYFSDVRAERQILLPDSPDVEQASVCPLMFCLTVVGNVSVSFLEDEVDSMSSTSDLLHSLTVSHSRRAIAIYLHQLVGHLTTQVRFQLTPQTTTSTHC